MVWFFVFAGFTTGILVVAARNKLGRHPGANPMRELPDPAVEQMATIFASRPDAKFALFLRQAGTVALLHLYDDVALVLQVYQTFPLNPGQAVYLWDRVRSTQIPAAVRMK